MSKITQSILIWIVLVLVFIATAALLSGCTTSAVTQCLPLRTWSNADQLQLMQEYDALPQGAQLKTAFQDYMAMRNADRACMGSKP